MNNRWHILSFKTMANFGYHFSFNSGSHDICRYLSNHFQKKNYISMSSKERIEKVLYSVEKGVLKNFANFTGKHLSDENFANFNFRQP